MGEAWDRVRSKERALQAQLRKFKRDVLKDLLSALTPSERNKFAKIFGVDDASSVPMGDIKHAIRICESTIEKHRDRILDVIAEKLDE